MNKLNFYIKKYLLEPELIPQDRQFVAVAPLQLRQKLWQLVQILVPVSP